MKKQITLGKSILFYLACFIFGPLLAGMIGATYDFFGTEPEFDIANECIETKVAKGYPRNFAREYCLGAGKYCVEKEYDENCEVNLKCCFATIEEDKKWNYLDYDNKGNKVEKKQ